jgi:ABC-type Fe3+ transport system permease subunit
MGLLAWVIMGLALWHYTIFLPDRFWGGIVGAFLASIAGALLTGIVISLAAHGIAIPGRTGVHATHLVTVLYAVPGALAGMAVAYMIGASRERAAERLAEEF